jgi:hypothetical protein
MAHLTLIHRLSPTGSADGNSPRPHKEFIMTRNFHIDAVGLAAIGAIIVQIAAFAFVLS